MQPTKPILLNESFIKNSKQFTSINEVWVWKHDLRASEHLDALLQEIDDFKGEAQEKGQETQVSTQRKRPRHESTSQET